MIQQQKKALGYIRAATQLQAEQDLSIDHQRMAILSFSMANGYEIDEYSEDTRSGLTSDIKWLDEYYANAHKKVQYLIVFSLERLGRDVAKAIELAKYLKEKYGVTVISVRQHDLDIPNSDPDTISNYGLE